MQRRDVLAALVAAVVAPRLDGEAIQADELARIERRSGGRLGVSVLDTGSHRRLAHRAGERFPMCSTFKWLLAAHVLARVDAGREQLARMVPYGPADLLEYAPVTREHVHEGQLSVATLAQAAIQWSDNTAANLLLASVGGPAALTAWLRSTGDRVTRLDRKEPELNAAIPGDPRDTTSPDAVVGDLQRILLGTVLSVPSREQLTAWLVGNRTGDARLRAGLPSDWRVGDKTGTGANGSTNDVAILWPPDGAPILVATYLTGTTAAGADREARLADVGRLAVRWSRTR